MWDSSIINLAKYWYKKCYTYQLAHIGSYKHFKFWDSLFSIIIILLSGLSSSTNFSSIGLDTATRDKLNIGIGILTLIIGILTGIKSHLGWNNRYEAHSVSYKGYAKVAQKIEKTIIMQKSESNYVEPDKFINEIADLIEILTNDAPSIPDNVLAKLKLNLGGDTLDTNPIMESIEVIKNQSMQTFTPEFVKSNGQTNGAIGQKAIDALRSTVRPERTRSEAELIQNTVTNESSDFHEILLHAPNEVFSTIQENDQYVQEQFM